jgi:hypothetical protein
MDNKRIDFIKFYYFNWLGTFLCRGYLLYVREGVKGLVVCKFLERYRVPVLTGNGGECFESERCRLGNEIPLGGCVTHCPDYESVK